MVTTNNMAQRGFKVALVQILFEENCSKNLENIANLVFKAASAGARLVVLPSFYNTTFDTKYAENIPNGPKSKLLSKVAKEHGIYLVGGSFSEIADSKYYCTCTVWDPVGKLVAKYQKLHLFDVNICGKIRSKESNRFFPGNQLATFNVGDVKVGLGVCYDLRFEELAKLYRQKGCEMLVFPVAFGMVTGKLHFKALQRARAIDNELFVLAANAARGNSGYIAWGHSQVTDPWGKILAEAGHKEEILFCDVDFKECDRVRQALPIFAQRRTDIYEMTCNEKHVC